MRPIVKLLQDLEQAKKQLNPELFTSKAYEEFRASETNEKRLTFTSKLETLAISNQIRILESYIVDNIETTIQDLINEKRSVMFELDGHTYILSSIRKTGEPVFTRVGKLEEISLDINSKIKRLF